MCKITKSVFQFKNQRNLGVRQDGDGEKYKLVQCSECNEKYRIYRQCKDVVEYNPEDQRRNDV